MKSIRTGVYAILKYKENIVVIKKGRGPFTGLYDLPGGKIDHGETTLEALEREINEEVGLKKEDFIIDKLLTVEETFVKHIREGRTKNEHIIAIVYLVNINKDDFDLKYIEDGGDSNGLKLININDNNISKTNILEKAINKYIGNI